MTEKIYIPFILEVKEKLSDAEYLVFALCYGLDERGKKIYFSNAYLGKLLQKSERTIQNLLSNIESKGFIKRIINGTKRIIKIVHDKVNELLGRKTSRPTTSNFAPSTMQNLAPNNIVINNKKNEDENSTNKSSLFFVNNYFKNISKEYDIDSVEIAETFINKYLSGDEYKKNIGNWQGRARNFFNYWLKNLNERGNEAKKLTRLQILSRRYKNASKVCLNNINYIVENGNVKLPSGDFSLNQLLALWDKDKNMNLKVE